MTKIDFSQVSDAQDFSPVPDGEYECSLVDVELCWTSDGHEMWSLRWKIQDGEYSGRLLFDNVAFTQKAMPKLKLICESCGLDVSAELDLVPDLVLGRQAMVTTYIDKYIDRQSGNEKARNSVPWSGYRPVPSSNPSTPF